MSNNYFHLISHHFIYRNIIFFFVEILQCFSTQDNDPDMQILCELLKFTEEYELLLKKEFGIAKICIYFCFLLSMVFNRTNAEVYPGIVWTARFIIQWSNSGIIINHIYYIWQLGKLVIFISRESLWDYTTTCILPSHHFHRSSYNVYFSKPLLWFTYLWKN